MMTGFRSLLLAGLLLASTAAFANPNDIVLSRLTYGFEGGLEGVDEHTVDSDGDGVLDREEPSTLGNGCGTGTRLCAPHQWAFRQLAEQLGVAFAPKTLAPPRTLGWNGFYVGLEGSLTRVWDDSRYWTLGTEGDLGSNVTTEGNPEPVLFVPSVHVRKGFPFGVELGTTISYMAATELVGLGLDVRVAPFEGFVRDIGVLPDLAVRGSVTRVTGDAELDLTVVGLDLSIGKRFGVLGQLSLAPYAAWQHMWIIANSEVVDATPSRDAWDECAPTFDEDARCVAADGSLADDSQCEEGQTGYSWQADFRCQSGEGRVDYENNIVFDRETLQHERGLVGLQLIWEHIAVTAELSMDLTRPDGVTARRQWGTSLGLGFDY